MEAGFSRNIWHIQAIHQPNQGQCPPTCKLRQAFMQSLNRGTNIGTPSLLKKNNTPYRTRQPFSYCTTFASYQMMRRIGNILIAATLSVMIIAWSVGIALVSCSHNRTTDIAQFAHSCCAAEASNDCCSANSHSDCHSDSTIASAKNCMSTQVLRLAPYDAAQHHAYDFQPVSVQLLPFANLSMRVLPIGEVSSSLAMCADKVRHGPPRSYLQFLRIWRL